MTATIHRCFHACVLFFSTILCAATLYYDAPATAPPRKATTDYSNFYPPNISTQSSITINYPIAYVRVPRIDDTHDVNWSEVADSSTLMQPGADLMLYDPNTGNSTLLVAGGIDAIADPYVSYDAQSIYFTRYYGTRSTTATDKRAGVNGSDIFRYDIPTGAITQLTHRDFAPNRAADDNSPFVVCNAQPCPLPDGGIAFVSNRNMYYPVQGFTRTLMQLFRMDADGSNVEKIGHMSLGGALHPMILKNGKIGFSSLESQGMRDPRAWSLWQINPDGTDWGPLFSQLSTDHVFHFATQLSSGRIVSEIYYIQNDMGMGPLFSFNEQDPSNNHPGPNFNQAWTAQIPDANSIFSFRPMGFQALTPWTNVADTGAPLSNPSDPNSPAVGKCTHPCGAPGNHLLASWSPGPVNKHYALLTPTPHNRIVLFPNGQPASAPNQMLTVLDDGGASPGYNLIWPRPVVPYQQIYGMPQPVNVPRNPNDGSLHTALPAGCPHGLIGTSSLYKRDSYPNGFDWNVTGSLIGQVGANRGIDLFYEGVPSNNFVYQGGDVGKFTNDDVHAIRIVAEVPRTDYTPQGPWWFNKVAERLRVLGEFPVRKFANGVQPTDPDGNPDTSFLAKVPANTPFTFQMLDSNGSVITTAQTWHQVRPGEIKNNCGGCHAHSQQPTDFSLTAAALPTYQVFDLTTGQTPVLTNKAGDTSGKQWDVNNTTGLKYVAGSLVNVEFYRDIMPILTQSCVPCHNGTANPIPGNLDFSNTAPTQMQYVLGAGAINVPQVYAVLAAGAPFGTWKGAGQPGTGAQVLTVTSSNMSRYIRKMQSRRSLLCWRVSGQRTDGYKDSDWPTETTPGNAATLPATWTNPANKQTLTGAAAITPYADVDLVSPANTFSQCPPPGNAQGIPPLTDDQVRTIRRWIDLGCPLDLYQPANANGWLQDENPPTLTIQSPAPGKTAQPITVLRFGLTDSYTGVDPTTLSVTSSVAIDGNAANTNIASLFAGNNGVYTYTLKTPLTGSGMLTVSAADKGGNRSKLVRGWTVDPTFSPLPATPPAPWQPLPEFIDAAFSALAMPTNPYPNPSGWAGWKYSGTSGLRTVGFDPYFIKCGYVTDQGAISQQVNAVAGTYTLSLEATQYYPTKALQVISVAVDGKVVTTFTPPGALGSAPSLTALTTSSFTIPTTGPHTISFAGTVTGTTGAFNNVTWNQVSTAPPPPPTPATPTGLIAKIGQVTIGWQAVTGATSYNVRRSTDGTTWTQVGTVTGTGYTDSFVGPGPIYYQVQAVNNAGTSAWTGSITVQATIPVNMNKRQEKKSTALPLGRPKDVDDPRLKAHKALMKKLPDEKFYRPAPKNKKGAK